MSYTLMKGLGWFLIALLLGMAIGWLLRSIAAIRHIRKLRASRADPSELDRLRARNATLEPIVAERDRLVAELAARAVTTPAPAESDADLPDFSELNLVAAAAVIGDKIKLDDLTVIEGVEPAIARLCHNIGIHTWADMAATEVSLLRTMLADAGARFEMCAPDSWPEQAGLLATGQWEAFTTLTASLRSGRSTD